MKTGGRKAMAALQPRAAAARARPGGAGAAASHGQAAHAAVQPGALPRYLNPAALAGATPALRLAAPDGEREVEVHDTPQSRDAGRRMGAYAFALHDRIFMGHDPGLGPSPSRDTVLRHELVHVLQSRQRGPAADAGALERQAHGWSGGPLLSADPAQPQPFLWVPFVLVAGYILLKPNTANAPDKDDVTYKSMDTGDYGKMVAEAVALGATGGLSGVMRKAGYSVVSTWAASGAAGSVSFRAIDDTHRGEFSGVDAYVVDGMTGATIGVITGGVFRLAGEVPGRLARSRAWFLNGASNDKAWAALSPKDKLFYEIGQKTLGSADEFAPYAHLSPVERGRLFVQEQGWAKALAPSSAKFVPGTDGSTFGTGPTPAGRLVIRSATGFGAGFGGHALYGDAVHDAWGLTPPPGTPPYSFGATSDAVGDDPFGMGLPSMTTQPPTLVVVPEGMEVDYLVMSGRLAEFPVAEGTEGLVDYDGPLECRADTPFTPEPQSCEARP